VTHGGLRFRRVDPRGLLGAVQFLTRIPVGQGDYKLEDTVVVTPTGCEELNRIPTEVTHKQ